MWLAATCASAWAAFILIRQPDFPAVAVQGHGDGLAQVFVEQVAGEIGLAGDGAFVHGDDEIAADDEPGEAQPHALRAAPDARLAGYKQTLLDHGLPYDESLVFIPDSANILTAAYEAAVRILQLDPRPTAIFAANDESAISAIAALRDHGLQVPKDMAVVSIDNIGIAEMIRPSLTTVDVPKKQMAAYAMQILLLHEQMKGQQTASIVLPTELIIRESCGAKNPNEQ